MQRFRLWRTSQSCGKQFRPKGATKGKRLKVEEFRGVEKDMHRSRRKGSSVEKPCLPKANPEGRKRSHCVIFGGEVSDSVPRGTCPSGEESSVPRGTFASNMTEAP